MRVIFVVQWLLGEIVSVRIYVYELQYELIVVRICVMMRCVDTNRSSFERRAE